MGGDLCLATNLVYEPSRVCYRFRFNDQSLIRNAHSPFVEHLGPESTKSGIPALQPHVMSSPLQIISLYGRLILPIQLAAPGNTFVSSI